MPTFLPNSGASGTCGTPSTTTIIHDPEVPPPAMVLTLPQQNQLVKHTHVASLDLYTLTPAASSATFDDTFSGVVLWVGLGPGGRGIQEGVKLSPRIMDIRM